MKTTIREVAQSAGVSMTTVSLAFQPDSRLSDKTREKVLAAAKKLNYVPNSAARKLRRGRTRTIGFVVNDITNPFYGWMLRLAEQAAAELGFELVFGETNWDSNREAAVVQSMVQSQVEGVILCSTERNNDSVRFIRNAGVPHIMVDTCPQSYSGSYVVNDAYALGYLAASHLIEIGCRAVAMFDANESMGFFSSFERMRQGFNAAAEEAKELKIRHWRVNAGLTIDEGCDALSLLIDKNSIPDGVFCVNDLSAFGVIDAADEHSIAVGSELAVVGVDNIEVSRIGRISLTSMSVDYPLMLKTATRWLIAKIEDTGIDPIQRIILPTLIPRASTLLF